MLTIERKEEREEFKEDVSDKKSNENDVNIVEIESRENTQRGANNSVVNNELNQDMTEEVELDEEIKFHSELKRDKGRMLNKNDSNFTLDSQQILNREDSINIRNENDGVPINREDSINFVNNSSGFGHNDESYHDNDNKNEFDMNIESKNDDNMQFEVDDDLVENNIKKNYKDNIGMVKKEEIKNKDDDVDN